MSPLRVGDLIHGHGGGNFSRDYYGCARVEAIGADWVVVRMVEGYDRRTAWFARMRTPDDLTEFRIPVESCDDDCRREVTQ